MRLRIVVASLAITLGSVAAPAAAHASIAPDRGVSSNIIGGNTVSSAPWAAAVFSGDSFVCSGTIISADYVLTATHCLGGSLSVRVGSVSRTSGGSTSTASPSSSRYDLALLRLATPIATTYVTLSSAYPPVGSTNNIYGWGRTCKDCASSPTLKTATVRVTSTNQQDNSGGRAIRSTKINGRAWSGDSGGPELYNGAQVGVASLADGTSEQIYGSVAYNRSWITSVAGV